MSKQVKLTDEAYEVLAAAEGNSFSERVLNLARNNTNNTSTTDINDRLTKMAQYLEKRFNELEEKVSGGVVWETPEPPEEMKGLKPDELPACCQSIFADGEPSCEHWKNTFVTEFGERKLGWKNILTGRTANDEAYHKYV